MNGIDDFVVVATAEKDAWKLRAEILEATCEKYKHALEVLADGDDAAAEIAKEALRDEHH